MHLLTVRLHVFCLQGGGEWHVPRFISSAVPAHLYAHTSKMIDFAALKVRAFWRVLKRRSLKQSCFLCKGGFWNGGLWIGSGWCLLVTLFPGLTCVTHTPSLLTLPTEQARRNPVSNECIMYTHS